MVVGGEGRIKKHVLRDCLYASWKCPLQPTGRTGQKRNDCEKNEQNTPRTRSAWATELTHMAHFINEEMYCGSEDAWARPYRPNTLKVSDSKIRNNNLSNSRVEVLY